MMFSIKGLSITLSVSLVVITGCVVGGLSFSSGNTAVQDARDVGDKGVEMALQGGSEGTMQMARTFMTTAGMMIEAEIDLYFKGIDHMLEYCHKMLISVHPDNATNPEWISKHFRHSLFTAFRTHSETAVQLGWYSVPFSPNSVVEPWGGNLAFFVETTNLTSPVFYGIETRDATNTYLTHNRVNVTISIVNDIGVLDPSAEFVLPESVVIEPELEMVYNRSLWNMMKPTEESPDDVLDPPNIILRSPVSRISTNLVNYAYMAVTHPLQVNRYPRQDGRIGFLLASASLEHTSAEFAKFIPPQVGFLYAVEKSHWDNMTGYLVGCSVGEAWGYETSPSGGRVVTKLLVTDHENDVIREHGVRTMEGEGYAAASAASGIEFFDVETGNTTVSYWVKTEKYSGGGFTWYIVLIIPRTLVMGSIDASTADIAAQTKKARDKADEDYENGFILALTLTGALSAVLLVLSVLLARRIVQPLIKLGEDMECVALMKLEEVDTTYVSQLQEVRAMQQSFREMLKNLKEYRNYMPQSVLVTSDTSDEDTHTSQESDRRRSHGSSTDVSGRGRVLPGFTEQSLKRKVVSVVLFNISRWMETIEGCSEGVVVSMHADYLSVIQSAVSKNKGVPDSFAGDRLLCSFNAVVHTASHRMLCAQACHTVREAVKGNLRLSFAASSCEARVGNMGCTGMKKFTIISPSVPFVHELERLNNKLRGRGLVDHPIKLDVMIRFGLRCLDAVKHRKRCSDTMRVYELMDAIEVKEEEWMYQMEACKTTQYTPWNTAMDIIVDSKDFAEARNVLSSYKGSDEMLTRLKGFIDAQAYTPVDFD